MKRNQKGFTLIEMLVVLSIFLIIASVTVLSLKQEYDMIEKNTFFSQFKSDILYAQQYAISHQTIVNVNIFPNQNYYLIRENAFVEIVNRPYSAEIQIQPGTLPLYFQFAPDGNINRFGSFLVKHRNNFYRVTFLIGMGRFYVTKQ